MQTAELQYPLAYKVILSYPDSSLHYNPWVKDYILSQISIYGTHTHMHMHTLYSDAYISVMSLLRRCRLRYTTKTEEPFRS